MYSMFSNSLRSGYTRPYTPVWTPYRSNQWLSAPDSDGAITDKRSLLSRPVYTGNNCKKFDGVGDRLLINHPDVNFVIGRAMRVEIYGALTNTTADKVIFASTSSSSNRLILKRSYTTHTTLVAGIYNGSGYVQVQEINWVTENVPVRINLDYDGTTLTVSLNGVAFSPSVLPLAADPAPGTTFFSRTDGKVNCAAICSYAKITPGPEYTFAAGPSLIEWDRSGNGFHGVYTSTSGINTMATTSDEATPWNILNGFSVVAMGDGTSSYYQTTIRPMISDKLEIQFNGNSTSTNNAIIGVYDATDATKRFLLYSDGNRYLRCVVNGTITVLSQTAILDNMWHTVIIDCVARTVKLDDAAPVAINITDLALTSDLRVLGSIGVGGSVALCSYIKYWQSGILTQHLRPNRKGELVNVLNGIKATTVGTGITIQYIPSIIDRSADVLGNEVMYPGGYLHNGAESGVKQTDDLFIGGTPNFYSADGETQDSKTYTDFAAHHPFDLGLLLQWEDVDGACMLKEAIQMPFAYMWVPLWYIAALAYIQTYTAACGASPLVPDEVTPGTGIGPDLDWADNGSGKVLLVESA